MALENYEEVPDRIRRFFEKYPEGSLQTKRVEYRTLPVERKIDGQLVPGEALHVIYHAAAYRTPDDKRPGHGMASEPLPGLTNYTRDSELMNAETSAWGRALVALGFVAKTVASANEVRSRTEGFSRPSKYSPESDSGEAASKPQIGRLRKDLKGAGVKSIQEYALVVSKALDMDQAPPTVDHLTKAQASFLIDWLSRNPVPTGKSDVPAEAEGFVQPPLEGGDPVPFDGPTEYDITGREEST